MLNEKEGIICNFICDGGLLFKKRYMKILFRHGQCDHNIENRISCSLGSKSELTELGREMIRESALELKNLDWYFRKSAVGESNVKVLNNFIQINEK